MATIELETLQITGLDPEKKKEIKQEAIARAVTVSFLMLTAYDEYVKKHPSA